MSRPKQQRLNAAVGRPPFPRDWKKWRLALCLAIAWIAAPAASWGQALFPPPPEPIVPRLDPFVPRQATPPPEEQSSSPAGPPGQFISATAGQWDSILRRLDALEQDRAKAATEKAAMEKAVEAVAEKAAKKAPDDKKPDDGWVDLSSEKWTVKLGGHVQLDYINWANADPAIAGTQDYFEFRRLRLVADGTGYGVFDFRLQMTLEPETVGRERARHRDVAGRQGRLSVDERGPLDRPLADRQLLRPVQPGAGHQRHQQHLHGALDSHARDLRRRSRSRHGVLQLHRGSEHHLGVRRLLRQHQRQHQGTDRRQPGHPAQRPAHLAALLRRALERPLPRSHRRGHPVSPTTRTIACAFAHGRKSTKGRG